MPLNKEIKPNQSSRFTEASPSDYSVSHVGHSLGDSCYVLTFWPDQNAIQGDAPEGSGTF